jgi:hypothetical protein
MEKNEEKMKKKEACLVKNSIYAMTNQSIHEPFQE